MGTCAVGVDVSILAKGAQDEADFMKIPTFEPLRAELNKAKCESNSNT
jgi:hypothetical protein